MPAAPARSPTASPAISWSGVEVVLADGRVLHLLNKLKKDNTGYDLKNLFVGAEGTLGIITAAVLKLFPAPKTVETAFVGVPSPDAALELLASGAGAHQSRRDELRADLPRRARIRRAPRPRLPRSAGEPHPWYVLLQISSAATQDLRLVLEETLETAMERASSRDAAIADSLEHRRAFWHLREMLPEAQKPEGGSIKHDISVPVAAVPEFLREADAAVAGADPRLPSGAVRPSRRRQHPLQRQPAGRRRHQGISRPLVRDERRRACVVAKFGGSISAEHGIGVMKRKLLPQVKDPVALDLMRALKRTLDPNGILNPGKVI